MNTASLNRDALLPSPTKYRGRALALAVVAHVLLIAALGLGVDWRNADPTPVAAELWSAVPQAAAPPAVQPPTATPPPPKVKPTTPAAEQPTEPAPAPKPKPAVPAPTPQPDPQIAIEKAKKRDEAKRLKAEREELELEKQQEAQAQKKIAADKQKAEKLKADKLKAEKKQALQDKAAKAAEKTSKAEASQLAATREANLKRMQGLVGATGDVTNTGSALRSSAPSAGYAGRIMARIKPNIVFTEAVEGNPVATVEVKLAPDGAIIGKRLIKSSGNKAWDEAVLRAVDRTEMLPRDIDGRVPPPFPIDFKRND
jgi:colicin import membrane protein